MTLLISPRCLLTTKVNSTTRSMNNTCIFLRLTQATKTKLLINSSLKTLCKKTNGFGNKPNRRTQCLCLVPAAITDNARCFDLACVHYNVKRYVLLKNIKKQLHNNQDSCLWLCFLPSDNSSAYTLPQHSATYNTATTLHL